MKELKILDNNPSFIKEKGYVKCKNTKIYAPFIKFYNFGAVATTIEHHVSRDPLRTIQFYNNKGECFFSFNDFTYDRTGETDNSLQRRYFELKLYDELAIFKFFSPENKDRAIMGLDYSTSNIFYGANQNQVYKKFVQSKENIEKI